MTREEAIGILEEEAEYLYQDDRPYNREAFDMAIEALKDRPQGKWIDKTHCQVDEDAYEVATCSHCKAEITLEYPNDNFCPNCGAMMIGGDTE